MALLKFAVMEQNKEIGCEIYKQLKVSKVDFSIKKEAMKLYRLVK